MKRIIAITGLIGSGKNEAADYIAKSYGFVVFDYADLIRDMMRKEGIEPTRINMQDYRLKHGNAFVAEAVAEKVRRSTAKMILLTPIRRPEDYEIPKKIFRSSIIMIHVVADEKTRFRRLKKRNSPRDPKTFREFREHERREFKIFDFDKTFAYADYTVENSGPLSALRRNLDRIMKEIVK